MLSTRQRILLGSATLLGGFALGVAADPRGLRRYVELGQDVARVETENARLRQELEVVRRKVNALRDDATLLERAARERGYVRADEFLFEIRP